MPVTANCMASGDSAQAVRTKRMPPMRAHTPAEKLRRGGDGRGRWRARGAGMRRFRLVTHPGHALNRSAVHAGCTLAASHTQAGAHPLLLHAPNCQLGGLACGGR